PVIAIGQPGERLPKLGAARKYVKGPDWQHEVIRLLNACRFACFVLGSSRGLLWELQQAVSYCQPQRVLLIIPPDNASQMASAWDAFVEEVRKEGIAMALPRILPKATLAVVFADRWAPIVVSGRPVVGNYRELARRVAASA